jgi:hypothetical protein
MIRSLAHEDAPRWQASAFGRMQPTIRGFEFPWVFDPRLSCSRLAEDRDQKSNRLGFIVRYWDRSLAWIAAMNPLKDIPKP